MENSEKRIEGVILDWAGTTVDFGCFAPVNAFIKVFENAGLEITLEEARAPMGMLKRDHIKAILKMDRIGKLWNKKYGKDFDENDIDKLNRAFESLLFSSLYNFTDLIPEVIETVKIIRENKLKIGSTTGYTDSMMEIVVKGAKEKGYEPDFWITPESTKLLGRPYPYMIFRNMENLKISSPCNAIKVGDTAADIKEGINAGVWSVGVVIGSSEMGLNYNEFHALSESEKIDIIEKTENKFLEYGADFTIKTMKELPELVEKINILLSEGKKPNGKFERT